MVILGIVAIVQLPVAQFPNIAPPEIQVSATYTGADALTVEESVATPIEQQMSGVDGSIYMYSNNANNGQMNLRVDFVYGKVVVRRDENTGKFAVYCRNLQYCGVSVDRHGEYAPGRGMAQVDDLAVADGGDGDERHVKAVEQRVFLAADHAIACGADGEDDDHDDDRPQQAGVQAVKSR